MYDILCKIEDGLPTRSTNDVVALFSKKHFSDTLQVQNLDAQKGVPDILQPLDDAIQPIIYDVFDEVDVVLAY